MIISLAGILIQGETQLRSCHDSFWAVAFYQRWPKIPMHWVKICEICGYRSQLGAVDKCHTIPRKVTEEAGMPESQSLKMCSNCHLELDKWYSVEVAKMVYDTKMQQFRYRTSVEMVQEYQSAFNGFVNYKKRRRKVH